MRTIVCWKNLINILSTLHQSTYAFLYKKESVLQESKAQELKE